MTVYISRTSNNGRDSCSPVRGGFYATTLNDDTHLVGRLPIARGSRNQGQPANYADIDDRSDEHEGNKHLRKNRHTAGDHNRTTLVGKSFAYCNRSERKGHDSSAQQSGSDDCRSAVVDIRSGWMPVLIRIRHQDQYEHNDDEYNDRDVHGSADDEHTIDHAGTGDQHDYHHNDDTYESTDGIEHRSDGDREH